MRFALQSDVDAVTRLINRAFEVERFFLDRDRLNAAEVTERLEKGKFILEENGGGLLGCVYVETRGERAYLGLLSVEPTAQKAGLGKRLMAAAEEHCRSLGCLHMDLNVVNLRSELPGFYRSLGYVQTGTAPFPSDVVTKLPCHFLQMTKPL